MKKLVSVLVATLVAVVVMSFTFSNGSDKANEPNGDNSCTVYVKYSSGSAASGVKVSTDVSGGVSCVGGRKFYTNSDGKATVQWSEGCKLKYIYIDGKSHKGEYKNGGTYTFTK